MEAIIVYGMSANITHEETVTVEEAFRMIPELYGYTFINIYVDGRCVYTTQGFAGFAWVCDDCPYNTTGGKVTRKQYAAIYNVRS